MPFMNNITGAAFTRFESRVCSSSLEVVGFRVEEEYAGAVAGSEAEGVYVERFFADGSEEGCVGGAEEVMPEEEVCFSIADRTFVASEPDTVSRTVVPRRRIK